MARVLIIEPAADTRELLRSQVARLGHEPLPPLANLAALAELEPERTTAIEVVVIEPAQDPVAALAELRRLMPRAAPVLTSIYPRPDSLAALGHVPYLLKPFSIAALAEALEAALVLVNGPASTAAAATAARSDPGADKSPARRVAA